MAVVLYQVIRITYNQRGEKGYTMWRPYTTWGPWNDHIGGGLLSSLGVAHAICKQWKEDDESRYHLMPAGRRYWHASYNIVNLSPDSITRVDCTWFQDHNTYA